MDENQIISNQQWGFRNDISTDISIGKVLEQVIKVKNDNQFGIGVFLDLHKAFDMVDHTILMLRLNHYGVRGTVAPASILIYLRMIPLYIWGTLIYSAYMLI